MRRGAVTLSACNYLSQREEEEEEEEGVWWGDGAWESDLFIYYFISTVPVFFFLRVHHFYFQCCECEARARHRVIYSQQINNAADNMQPALWRFPR